MDDTLFAITLTVITFLIMIFLILILDNRLTKVESELRATRNEAKWSGIVAKTLWDEEDKHG